MSRERKVPPSPFPYHFRVHTSMNVQIKADGLDWAARDANAMLHSDQGYGAIKSILNVAGFKSNPNVMGRDIVEENFIPDSKKYVNPFNIMY